MSKSLKTLAFKKVALEINKMTKVDQRMRRRNNRNPSYWDKRVDRRNTARMREIVRVIGWPSVSKVGRRASNNAWLLVQHADHDRKFQEACLKMIKKLPAGEVDPRNIAYLEDRILVGKGEKQLYGTQFYSTSENEDLLFVRPIARPQHLERRRKKVGLSPFAESVKHMEKKYKMRVVSRAT